MDIGGSESMDVASLKAQIKSNNIDHILIFTGDEWKIQEIYIQHIAKVTGLDIMYINSIASVAAKFQSISFLQKNYIYIARDDVEYEQNEKLQALVKDTIGKNIFILLVTSLDKRLKFYKTHKDSIIEFESLKPAILKKYIQQEMRLSDQSCEKLMEICEYNYGRCLLEIDKIRNFMWAAGPRTAITYDSAFEKLLADGTINTPPKDAIFEFVDAVLDRKPKCFDLYKQCQAVNEATLVMLSVLYNNTKAVLQVQSCKSTDISKATGLTGWQIMNAKKHIGKYRIGELVNIMNLCIECEQGIKTGKMEEQFAVEYILVNVL